MFISLYLYLCQVLTLFYMWNEFCALLMTYYASFDLIKKKDIRNINEFFIFCHKIYKQNLILWCCCHQLQLLCLLCSECSLCRHEFSKCQDVTTNYSFDHATFNAACPPEVITKKEMLNSRDLLPIWKHTCKHEAVVDIHYTATFNAEIQNFLMLNL